MFLVGTLASIFGLYYNIVYFEITWTLVSLCELVRLYVTDAQANGLAYATSVNIFSDFTIYPKERGTCDALSRNK